MTTAVKGTASQMNSVSAVLIYPGSFVPFHTQCEPFRCQRPRDIHRRAWGAQRVSALHRHLAANLISQSGGINMKAQGAGVCVVQTRAIINHPGVATVGPRFNKESALYKHSERNTGRGEPKRKPPPPTSCTSRAQVTSPAAGGSASCSQARASSFAVQELVVLGHAAAPGSRSNTKFLTPNCLNC